MITKEKKNFDIKECLDIVLKKYNNHEHSSIKYRPNEIFYSNSEELFKKVLNNIKNSFKYINSDYSNFKLNEKYLLNGKFKIQKTYKGKEEGVIVFDKLKNKKVYTKINVVIKNVKNASYIISIAKKIFNYSHFLLIN